MQSYRRVLLKLSGESLMGDQHFGINEAACGQVASSIKEALDLGVQMGIVIGGGNIFRGSQAQAFGFSRTPADHIGMLATLINGMVLHQALASLGIKSRVMSALYADSLVEKYNWEKAIHYLEQGVVVIFVGGTGNPYFTTDSAAALKASEIGAEILLKATKVDGIYSEDPQKNPKATKYPHLTYAEVLIQKLNVMDATAIALCRENNIPICVFNVFEPGRIAGAVRGEPIGSLVKGS